MATVFEEGEVPQSSTDLIGQEHDTTVLATQSTQRCAHKSRYYERKIALIGNYEVLFASPFNSLLVPRLANCSAI